MRRLTQDVDAVVGATDRVELGSDAALREPDDRGGVVNGNRLCEFLEQSRRIPRCRQANAGNDLQDREIPHPVVARAVGAGHTGAVEHERDTRLVQGDVHEHLVEGAVDEGRVDGDDGVQAAVGEASGRRDRVLFGDAHVEDAVRVLLGELVQPGRAQHRGGDPHEAVVTIGKPHELIGEHARPRRRTRGLDRLPRLRIDLPDRVELVGDVGEGRLVALALLRDGVHDDRRLELFRLPQGALDVANVVPVDRPDVLNVEVRVQRLVVRKAREEAVQAATHAAVERAAGRAEVVEHGLGAAPERAVRPARAHARQEARHAPDRRRVRAPVVVDDDDQVAAVVIGDVVERLPGHAASEGAIPHDGDDVAIALAGHLVRAGNAVRPAERAGGVRAFHDVVRRLRALRVAGQAVLLTQTREILAAREELVHVRLVAGVPHDGVAGRVEDAVNAEGELDDAEVRAQVTARLRHLSHQEPPNLVGELLQLGEGERVQVAGFTDRSEQLHPFTIRGSSRARATKPRQFSGGSLDESGMRERPAEPRRIQRAVRPRCAPRPGCAARTAGFRRCGSSQPHRGCRYGQPRRTRAAACRRASASWESRRPERYGGCAPRSVR